MPNVLPRLGLAIAACWLAAAAGACHGPDPYYRHLGNDGGAAGQAGVTGKAGSTGNAGSGAAGTGLAGTGAAGTGVAGAGVAGAGAAGTTGAAGTGAAGTGAAGTGAAGTNVPCTKCKVKVLYTCRSSEKEVGMDDMGMPLDTAGQASFILDVTNDSSTSIALTDLTLRYWYTMEAGKEQELNCDYAKLGCTNVVHSADTAQPPKFQPVLPPKPMANAYVELAFKAGALSLDPFLNTGEIQLRLHNKDFSPIMQRDDYSFSALMLGNPIEQPKITAYVKGVLVWGTEPQ